MRKQERQKLIRQILQDNNVYRQEDLVKLLEQQGVWVTQATISRDVKDMQLIKLPTLNGEYIYSVPTEKKMNTKKKLAKLISDTYVFSNCHRDLCLIKVLPGNGPILASLIEQMKYEQVFATMGDDNTVMIFAYSAKAAEEMHEIILDLAKKGN